MCHFYGTRKQGISFLNGINSVATNIYSYGFFYCVILITTDNTGQFENFYTKKMFFIMSQITL